jgi:hypothetical protein
VLYGFLLASCLFDGFFILLGWRVLCGGLGRASTRATSRA